MSAGGFCFHTAAQETVAARAWTDNPGRGSASTTEPVGRGQVDPKVTIDTIKGWLQPHLIML